MNRDDRTLGDGGMTLVELLVAMSLTTIVLAAVGAVFVGSLRTLGVVNAKAEMTGSSQTAMQTITTRLRAADYPPPDSVNTAIVLEAAYDAVTVTSYVSDPTLANTLATSLETVNPDDNTALFMRKTGMVPKKLRYLYLANASACGDKSGITATLTSPRYLASGGQIFAWDTTPTTSCVLRTTTVPSLTDPIFTYYGTCDTDVAPASLATTRGVKIDLTTSDTDNNSVELENRICLVNVSVTP